MLSFKPRSILQLTITGFLTVVGLLLIALVSTARQIDALGEQSQRVINRSVAAVDAGRMLTEQSFAMERNIRQYQVLQDAQILTVYQERRAKFAAAAKHLSELDLEPALDRQVSQVLADEYQVFEAVRSPESGRDATVLLPALVTATQDIATGIDVWIGHELEAIQAELRHSRAVLTAQAVTLTLCALVLAGVFTALITRPLAQVNRAINRLGDGNTDTPVSISGPADLVQLGEGLDWLRERLRILERQRGAFLRHVSHELKTPLTAIQESAALLSEGVTGDLNAQQRDILRIQQSNCQRLTARINELLKHHEASFAVLDQPAELLRLDILVQEVLAERELALRARSLQVATALEPCTVKGKREQLRVVLDNLLSNAIHYSPLGATVSLRVYSDDAALCEVTDEGPGVREEDAARIFDAFYRGANADDGAYAGSGLGLAIAEEYAKANHGGLSLVQHAAKGALFRLRLPLEMN